MKTRRAKISDIKECMKIQALDKKNYWKKIDFEKMIRDNLVIFLVAEEDKKIMGYINGYICPTKRTEAMIHETRTNKNFRHKKIGTKLVNEFCKIVFKQGVKNTYVMIEPKLINFYIKSCKFKKSTKWIEAKKSKKCQKK